MGIIAASSRFTAVAGMVTAFGSRVSGVGLCHEPCESSHRSVNAELDESFRECRVPTPGTPGMRGRSHR